MTSKKKDGRPSKFTIKLSDEICERIAGGESLRSICLDDTMPAKSTVFAWLTQHETFRTKYTLARDAQADVLVDEMTDIADDGSNDWMEKKNAAGEVIGWQENGEAIRRSQLRILTRQWIAEKMRPKKYGTKVELEHGVTNDVAQLLDAVNGKTRGLPNRG